MTGKVTYKNKIIKIRPEIIVCLFLVLSILIVYWQVINYEFVGFDDDLYVTDNSNVKNGLTVSSIIWAFKSTHASNWHPLTYVGCPALWNEPWQSPYDQCSLSYRKQYVIVHCFQKNDREDTAERPDCRPVCPPSASR